MRIQFLLIGICCIPFWNNSATGQSVGIGTATPNSNAILHINVPNSAQPQGMILPSMTTILRTSMTLGVSEEGMIVYDTDLDQVFQWDGTSWSSINGAAGVDSDWQTGLGTVYNSSDLIGIGLNNPLYPLHVSTTDTIGIYVEGGAINNNTKVIKGIYTGGGAVDPVAVQGICVSTDPGFGFGGQFRSNFVGIDAEVDGGAYNAFNVYGTFSEARGTDGERTGVLAQAIGGQDVIGLEAIALGGVNNTGVDVVSDGIAINARSQDVTGTAVSIYSDYNIGTNVGIGVAAIGYLGVYPPTSGLDIGLFASCDPAWGWAVYTDGDVGITGDLFVFGNVSKLGGSFKIDHPQDPENKYLVHSFVESPDMMNLYNGNITTGNDSIAVVELPDYFEALNMDFRYQLTVIGELAQVAVSEEINNNRFQIKSDKPNVKVSWQVTGVRMDKYANENRIIPVVDKPDSQKGTYLYSGYTKSKSQSSKSKFSNHQKSSAASVEKVKPREINK